jgi:hypothetical protein
LRGAEEGEEVCVFAELDVYAGGALAGYGCVEGLDDLVENWELVEYLRAQEEGM